MKDETIRKVRGEKSEYLHKAILYAQKCHIDTNHLYDGGPYFYHLQGVATIAERFIGYFPIEMHDAILAAAWSHDTIEDTRQTYNDVKTAIGEQAADIVYALTNEKGKNRKARANEKYYSEMKLVPGAVFVKLCDRLSNIIHSVSSKSSMLQAYRKEHDFFTQMLFDGHYPELWEEMNKYLNQ
jgi:(p)ppGpp synthase/HD superfamily hydrolase